jgi:hypothetical protein
VDGLRAELMTDGGPRARKSVLTDVFRQSNVPSDSAPLLETRSTRDGEGGLAGDLGCSTQMIRYTMNSPSTQSNIVKYDNVAYTLLYKMREKWPGTFSNLTKGEGRAITARTFSKLLVLAVNFELTLTQQNGPFSEILIEEKLSQATLYENTGGQF